MAYRALTEFAFRSRILDITNISVKVETVASEMSSQRVHINNQSVAAFHYKV